MQATARGMIWVAALFMLPGCVLSEPSVPSEERPAPSETADGSNGASPPLSTQWNHCHGGDTAFTWAGDTGPGKPPGNWSKGQGEGSDVLLMLLTCERFSWGPFERPVTFVAETHNNIAPPQECRQGPWEYYYALNALYVNDSQVAQYLQETYGLPAKHANITVTDASFANYRNTYWHWAPDGGSTSWLNISEVNVYAQGITDNWRWAWISHAHVYFLDWISVNIQDEGTVYLTPGSKQAPMLYYGHGPDPYMGHGDFLPTADITGQIQIFGDEECKQPLAS
jgi:hypothetical protein